MTIYTNEMTISTTAIAEDQFDTEFQPQPNMLNPDASWNGCLYETYGEERSRVFGPDPHHVWTWVEDDEGAYLVAGLHYVNRLGYLCLSASKFPVFDRWLRLVLTSALDEVTDTLNPPPLPVCFMLDELATLGHGGWL